VRDRDDITIQIENKRAQLTRTSERLQPLHDQRAKVLAQLEAAMAAHLTSRNPWPELDDDPPEMDDDSRDVSP
jgi:hypothetical protein